MGSVRGAERAVRGLDGTQVWGKQVFPYLQTIDFSFRISKLLIIAFPLQVQLIIWRSLNSSPVLTQFDCAGTRGYESSQGK